MWGFFCLCVCVLVGVFFCVGWVCVGCVCGFFIIVGSFVWVFLLEFQESEPMPLSVGPVVVGTEVGGCDWYVTLRCEQVPQPR